MHTIGMYFYVLFAYVTVVYVYGVYGPVDPGGGVHGKPEEGRGGGDGKGPRGGEMEGEENGEYVGEGEEQQHQEQDSSMGPGHYRQISSSQPVTRKGVKTTNLTSSTLQPYALHELILTYDVSWEASDKPKQTKKLYEAKENDNSN